MCVEHLYRAINYEHGRTAVAEAKLQRMRHLSKMPGFLSDFAHHKWTGLNDAAAFELVNAECKELFGVSKYETFEVFAQLHLAGYKPAKPAKRVAALPQSFIYVEQGLHLLKRWHKAGYTTQDKFCNAMAAVYPEYAEMPHYMAVVEFYMLIHVVPALIDRAEKALNILKPGA